MKNSPLAVIGLLAVTISWGATFVLMKPAIESQPFYDFLATRFTIAVLVMLLALRFVPRLLPGVLLAGIINQFPILGVVGFGIMVAGVLTSTTRRGKSEPAAPKSSGPRSPKPSTFEARWDRRMGGDD